MPKVKLVGGKGDGRTIDAPVELRHGCEFRHMEIPRTPMTARSASEAQEVVKERAETYRIVQFALEGEKRFIAAPTAWTDAQALDRLLDGFRGRNS